MHANVNRVNVNHIDIIIYTIKLYINQNLVSMD
jgi:hypothetical protein